MRSATLKWILIITSLVTGALVTVQLYWLDKIYNYEQKEFYTSVIKSIQGVYEDLDLMNSPVTQLRKLIEHPDANTFLFRIDSIPSKEMLFENLSDNLEDFQVFSDCHVALYVAPKNHLLYTGYLRVVATKHPGANAPDLKTIHKNYTYIRLYFPYRNQYILNSMKWWIASAVFLLLVLIAFSSSIFYLYRQKFLNEIQNDFIQNVTHEFQTPLTALIVGLDAVTKSTVHEQPGKFETYIRLMQAQTAYLKHHIENLMKVLKAEASGLVLDRNEVIPNELVRNALLQLDAMIEEKQAKVTIELEETNAVIQGDKSSLYVAVLNLISNALKFARHPLITIETKANGSKYYMSVKDNGIGIEDKLKKKLFRKFYRVPSGAVHDVKGLGLGLYFVKKVIDGHKGTITVKSIVNKGAEFIIELPKN